MQYESQFSQSFCLFRFDFESEFSYSSSIVCADLNDKKKPSLVYILDEVTIPRSIQK